MSSTISIPRVRLPRSEFLDVDALDDQDAYPPHLVKPMAITNWTVTDGVAPVDGKIVDRAARSYTLATKCAAEFLATLFFVFVGTMQAVTIQSNTDGSLHAAVAHGLAIFILVACYGHISGAHINTAVSLSVTLSGRMPYWHFPFYAVSQLFGGFCGALITRVILNDLHFTTIQAGATLLARPDYKWYQGLVGEGVGTFALCTTVLLTAVDEGSILAPLAIGLTLAADIMAVGGVSGASMNPARSLGPNLVGWIWIKEAQRVSGFWSYHYIYYVGPFAGAAVAALAFRLFFAKHDRLIK